MKQQSIIRKIGKHLWDNIYAYLLAISMLMNIIYLNYYNKKEVAAQMIEYYSTLHKMYTIISDPTTEDSIKAIKQTGDVNYADVFRDIRLQSYRDTLNAWIRVNNKIDIFDVGLFDK